MIGTPISTHTLFDLFTTYCGTMVGLFTIKLRFDTEDRTQSCATGTVPVCYDI
jgi:hypothetical protein